MQEVRPCRPLGAVPRLPRAAAGRRGGSHRQQAVNTTVTTSSRKQLCIKFNQLSTLSCRKLFLVSQITFIYMYNGDNFVI